MGVGAEPKGDSVSGARVVRAVVGGSDSAAPNNGGGAGAGDGDGAPAASAGDGAPASASGATPCRGGAGSAGTAAPFVLADGAASAGTAAASFSKGLEDRRVGDERASASRTRRRWPRPK